MKKSTFAFLLLAATSFLSVVGYAETKKPVKEQTELFVGSVEFP